MGGCFSSQARAEAGDAPLERWPRSFSGRFGKESSKNPSVVGSGEVRWKGFIEEASEAELQCIPGRMFSNGASESACLFTQQGRKGTNQDAMIVWEDYNAVAGAVFCGVFDGHGPYGHLVARRVRDSLPLKLKSQWNSRQNGDMSGSPSSGESESAGFHEEWIHLFHPDGDEKLPEALVPLKRCFLEAFKLMDMELKLLPTIDCFCSGTTAVAVLKQGEDLVIGNLGDSRAIMGTRDAENKLIARQLTVDLKPNLPREAARILRRRGRVFALQDEPEVARLWLPHSDSPGLAMSRAFGDFCLKDYGLISVPQVSYHRVTENDEFIILATDGVWDVLSNGEAVDIVMKAPTRATAARALIDCAVRSWRLKFPTSKNDDCAAVCMFFHQSSSPSNNMPSFVPETDAATNNTDEIMQADERRLELKSRSTRSLAECLSTPDDDDDDNWSALEGITRVNSLLKLPRFLSGDERSSGRKSRLQKAP